jgi:hypothetical protein
MISVAASTVAEAIAGRAAARMKSNRAGPDTGNPASDSLGHPSRRRTAGAPGRKSGRRPAADLTIVIVANE